MKRLATCSVISVPLLLSAQLTNAVQLEQNFKVASIAEPQTSKLLVQQKYTQLIEQLSNKQDMQSVLSLCAIQLKIKATEQATTSCQQAVKLSVNATNELKAMALNNRGVMYFQQGNTSSSIQDFVAALSYSSHSMITDNMLYLSKQLEPSANTVSWSE